MTCDWTTYLELSPSVQALIRVGYSGILLGTLLLSLPSARRFFGTEKHRGYADSNRWLDLALSLPGRTLLLCSWLAATFWLLTGRHTVLAAFWSLLLCRFFFVSMRWKSVTRGMGAPGFMLYWLAALVFFLEYTAYYDVGGWLRPIAILVFKVDFAVIMICAGQYKLFSGYPQNNGMERGMVNPWWGRLWRFYRNFPPESILFRFLNHCAYLTELVAGVMMLWAATAELGALAMAGSFVFIACNIRLGWLCENVIVCCFLFSYPGGWVDSLLPTLSQPSVEAGWWLWPLNGALAAFLLIYLVLLPVTKAGLYYNFYAKKRLPERWQRFQDGWANLMGIIIWRVFTIDNTNFYVNAYLEDRQTGERELFSRPGEWEWSKGWRYIHVCEFVAFVSVFTTLKYFPSNSPLFRKRLLRYARSIPHGDHQVLVFQWVDIKKENGEFVDVASREFRVDLREESMTAIGLADGRSETDSLRYADLVEGHQVGSYAPTAKS